MTVNSVSGGGTPWQILAEQRAARAAAADPASTGAGMSGAGTSGAPTGTAAAGAPASNAVTGGLPQPAAGLFQYLAGLHAGHGDGDGDGSGGGGAATGGAATGAPAGTDLAQQMLGLQSYNPAFAMLGATTALSA